ncbi:MAG: ergothioneine biosynthesis protein EgtB [Pyrinomonadaceae bacterium]|nr:ergothioneine biosynthesis protein EgtB [Pyrinomonadaceae bacterium]
MVSTTHDLAKTYTGALSELYRTVRARTMRIVAPLEIEDYVIQTAEFMSPPRWHIGHTSWFFETLLQSYLEGYQPYSEDFLFYFNSYYEGFGARIERAKRGTRSRPTVQATLKYRHHIDDLMIEFLEKLAEHPQAGKVHSLVTLGLEHEMQHQELLVYDIKHLLCDLYKPEMTTAPATCQTIAGMAEVERGLFWLGCGVRSGPTVRDGSEPTGETPAVPAFAFDNEKPAHQVFLQDFAIDRALVSNGDFLQFIRSGGYRDFRWWFSEGWQMVSKEQWQAPLYWEIHDGQWMIRDFKGLQPVESKADEPVSHVSFYEASAYAGWAGKRLPTEAEWEKAACFDPTIGDTRAFPWGDDVANQSQANLLENELWGVTPIGAFPEGQNAYDCQQMIGDVWEWTSSDYVPYPGFKSEFDEYNDKWFVNQKVLRGGSYATPRLHIRSTYRNFFHAHERWMISGFRCAKDLSAMAAHTSGATKAR